MILQFIENSARLIMEWAMKKRYEQRPIVDEIADSISYYDSIPERNKTALYDILRTEKVKRALL